MKHVNLLEAGVVKGDTLWNCIIGEFVKVEDIDTSSPRPIKIDGGQYTATGHISTDVNDEALPFITLDKINVTIPCIKPEPDWGNILKINMPIMVKDAEDNEWQLAFSTGVFMPNADFRFVAFNDGTNIENATFTMAWKYCRQLTNDERIARAQYF